MERIIIFLESIAIAIGAFFYWKNRNAGERIAQRDKEMSRRMYELAILKELGDRIGYSLNVQQIADVITGSLHQFIEYSAVSYMLLQPEKIIFKVHLEKSVNRKFLDDVRERMLGSLSALLDKEFKKDQVEEVLSGAILVEELIEPVSSFFNIPLVIGEKVVGILTVAHTKTGLYKEEEMTILYKIINQASQAVTRLEEVVRIEEQKLNAMVQSMTEGVVMTDKDYRVVVANPVVKKILGLAGMKEEPTIFDFIDALQGKFDIRGRLEESVKLDKILEIPEVFLNEHFFQIFVAPVKSTISLREGEILGGVVIFHDITHEKEIEKLRDDFTSMMVHELRSPLDGIHKIAELLLNKKALTKPDKVSREYAPLIFKSSADMLELVNSLLDAAKLEAGKFEIVKETNSLEETMHERVEFYKTSADDAHVSLSYVMDSAVPKEMLFDRNAISRVLNNFISNALKFTKEGGRVILQAFLHETNKNILEEAKAVGVHWFVKMEEKSMQNIPKSVIIAVTDSGMGISSQNIPMLFNKFKQFRTSTSEGKGTGLGLVIAKGIIEAHGGMVGVASDEGVGATFYFNLPIA